MARRREQTVENDGDALILPRHLADTEGLSGEQSREIHRDRRAWFVARGIDPRDWGQVHAVLKDSWAAYGLNRGALTRARLRVTDPREMLRYEVEKENMRCP